MRTSNLHLPRFTATASGKGSGTQARSATAASDLTAQFREPVYCWVPAFRVLSLTWPQPGGHLAYLNGIREQRGMDHVEVA